MCLLIRKDQWNVGVLVVGQWRSGDEVLQLCSGVVEVEEIREYIGEREREDLLSGGERDYRERDSYPVQYLGYCTGCNSSILSRRFNLMA